MDINPDSKVITLHSRYSGNQGIERLNSQFANLSNIQKVIVDCIHLEFIQLGPMTYLLGSLKQCEQNKIAVSFINLDLNRDAIRYMSRMNFFALLQIQVDEPFKRQPHADRFYEFVEIQSNDRRSSTADEIAAQVATCITGEDPDFDFSDQPPPENNFFEAISYSVSELIKNVQQHSLGTGFVSAQYYPRLDSTSIAIVDTGIGVRESFNRHSSPHANLIATDVSALRKALEAEVSSKTHQNCPFRNHAENAGVGLTLLTDIALQAGGCFQFLSGAAMVHSEGECELSTSYQGTYVYISFNRSALNRFQEMLEIAKSKYLDLPTLNPDIESIFI